MDKLPVINITYSIFRELTVINSKLEKRWRHSIGINTENKVLECLNFLIKAKNAPKPFKQGFLIEASSTLEVVSLQLRFYLEENLANETKIFQIQANIREAGRMIGGWTKSLN